MKQILTILLICLSGLSLANGNYAYVISAKQSTIKTYKFNPATGVIEDEIARVNTSIDPEDMSIYNNGKNLYTLSWLQNKLSLFDINPQTGELTPADTPEVATGVQPWAITFSPNQKCAYTGNYGGTTISQYQINPNNGEFIAVNGGQFDSKIPAPAGVKVSPDGKFLFAAYPLVNKIAVFAIDPASCQLNEMGITFPTPVNPVRMAIVHNYLYVACGQSNQIAIYKINSDGSLSSLNQDSSISSINSGGYGLMSLKASNDNNYLYANNKDSNLISRFKINPDGSLTLLGTRPSNGVGPRSLSFDSSGNYAYEVNQLSNTIAEYNFDANSGDLLAFNGENKSKRVDIEPYAIAIVDLH